MCTWMKKYDMMQGVMHVKTQLATSFFKPQGEVKAVMVVVHGMAEHRKRYDRFAEILSEHGIAVLTYDQRGHGESVSDSSELGYFGRFDGWMNLVRDLNGLISSLKKKFDVPVILLGHSMGSMVARCYLKRYAQKVDAVILSGAPNFTPFAYAGRLLAYVMCTFGNEKRRSALLHQMVEGGFIRSVENPQTEVDWLSYNPVNVQRYIQDDLCGFTFTNRGYEDLMFLMIDMHRLQGAVKPEKEVPILFVSGKDDPCTGSEAGLADSMHALNQQGYKNITNLVYENARHEILNEKISDKVIEDIVQWIEKAF